MTRLLPGIVTVAFVAICCGYPSLTTPTSAPESATFVRVADGTGCPSPSPLPVAIFGAQKPSDCSAGPALNAVFKITPDPPAGAPALAVAFNMCKSTDSDPTVTLHFHVDYGDGSDEGGNACYYPHTYASQGTFPATACVWDRRPASAPGVCKSYSVSVVTVQQCAVSFSGVTAATIFAPILTALIPTGCLIDMTAQTTGTAGCGNPLTVLATDNGTTVLSGSVGSCPPGSPCSLGFNIPYPSASTPPVSVAVNGVDAPGAISFHVATGCVVLP